LSLCAPATRKSHRLGDVLSVVFFLIRGGHDQQAQITTNNGLPSRSINYLSHIYLIKSPERTRFFFVKSSKVISVLAVILDIVQ
jgi:hypothetical protein